MEIKVGVYTIHSDSKCMWITQRVRNLAKNAKNEYVDEKVAGYSATIEELLNSFLKNQCRRSGAREVRTLLRDIDKRDRDCKRVLKEYLKNCGR